MESPDLMGQTFQNPNLDEAKTKPSFRHLIIQKDEKDKLLQQVLKKDPYLEYLGEDEHSYQVRGWDGNIVTIAKDRDSDSSTMKRKSKSARDAFRWLALAVIGLAFSGLGALLFAPASIIKTIQMGRKGESQPDQVRRRVVQGIAIGLLVPAALLAYLFWLHLRP